MINEIYGAKQKFRVKVGICIMYIVLVAMQVRDRERVK